MFDWREDRWPLTFDLPRANASYSCDPASSQRKCIPLSAGGESTGLTDTAIMVEELYAVNASVTLTLMGTFLGLLPLLIGGTEEQRSRLLSPFLKQAGAPLA